MERSPDRKALANQTAMITKTLKKLMQPDEIKRLGAKLLRKPAQKDLVILDDAFPHLLSAFRIAEYNAYLQRFPDSVVYSTTSSFPALRESRNFEGVREEYEADYPEFAGRAFRFAPDSVPKSKLIYMAFINNAYSFIDLIEKHKTPFIFTLYPGGGFRLNDAESDRKLRRVCSSPCFRKVIVTQRISRDYLLDNGFVRPEQVELIYGGVFPSHSDPEAKALKSLYGRDKETFDICFVAHKYMERGVDKGYDTFVEVARICQEKPYIRFHVVGPFDDQDMDVSSLKDRISFCGTQGRKFFTEFYSRMDIIVSPNIPFALFPGAFDGFPTGCCMEAALSGVAVFLHGHVATKHPFRRQGRHCLDSEGCAGDRQHHLVLS